jgi:hypothetical protein
MPGARGRLIANILYKLVNNESTPICFTEHNSAHTNIYDWDMKYISDINQAHTNPNKKPVFFTHLYPTRKHGVVFINVPRYKLDEVCLNAVIKNVVAKVEFIKGGGILDDTGVAFLKTYEKLLPNNYIDLLDDNNLHNFLLSIQKVFVPKISSIYHEFIDNHSFEGTDVLSIDYDKMFDKENGKYIVLNQLTRWMNVDYNNDIHNIYEQYDLDKYKVFEKYCPWFNITEK